MTSVLLRPGLTTQSPDGKLTITVLEVKYKTDYDTTIGQLYWTDIFYSINGENRQLRDYQFKALLKSTPVILVNPGERQCEQLFRWNRERTDPNWKDVVEL